MAFRSTLLLLLLSLALVECRLYRETESVETMDYLEEWISRKTFDVKFYREHPEIVVRACGRNLLKLIDDVRNKRCPEGKARNKPLERAISEHCCIMEGCSYIDIEEFLCWFD